MAEKVTIYELDIAVDEAVKHSVKLQEEIDKQKEKLAQLRVENKQNTAEYVLLDAELKVNQSNLRTNNQMIQKYTASNMSAKDSIIQMRNELSAVSIAWAAEAKATGENSEAAKKLAARKKELTLALEREEKATGDARRGVGKYKEGITEAIKEQANAIPGANKFISVLSKFGPIGAGIAAGAALISAPFIAFFKSFDDGMDLAERKVSGFKNAMGVLQLEVGRLGQSIVGNQDSAIKWGTALQFVGRWMAGIANIIPGFNKWIGETANKMNEASKSGEQMAKMNQVLEERENAFITVRSKTNKKIAEAKLLYEDETQSISTRLNALKQSLNLELATNEEEAAIQDQRVKNIQLEKALKKERWTDEDEKRLREAIAKRDELETQSIVKQKKLQSTINSAEKEFRRQELEEKKKAAEAAVDNLNYELEKYKLTNQSKLTNVKELNDKIIKDESDRLDKINQLAKDKLDFQLKNGLISQNEYNLQVLQLTTDKNNAIDALNQKLVDQTKDKEEEERQRKLEAAQIDFENQQELFDNNVLSQLDAQKAKNDYMRAEEIRNAKETGASVELINKKYNKADIELTKARENAKLSLMSGFTKNIATIFGEQTAVGKAAAVATTTIDTYMSATAAYSALAGIPFVGPILGIAAAGAAVASGLANVKKILSVKSGLPGDSGGGSVSAEPSNTTTSTPSASIERASLAPEIGQGIVSRQTNIQEQSKISLRPTLVIDDVTSKQSSESYQNKTATV